MVLHKRLDNGSREYEVPPNFPRSAKGKRSIRRKFEDNRMCAFDLLATVAGKLLTDGEDSLSIANINGVPDQEQFVEPALSKMDPLDQHSCNDRTLASDPMFVKKLRTSPKGNLPTPKEAASEPDSAFVKSDSLDKGSLICSTNGAFVNTLGTIQEKSTMWGTFPCPAGSDKNVGDKTKTPVINSPDLYSLVDPMDMDVKPPTLVSSGSSSEVPLYREVPCGFSPKFWDRMQLSADRDDDENSSMCTHPTTITNRPHRPHHAADQRVRKLLASKFVKVAPSRMHEEEHSNTDAGNKSAFWSMRMCYRRQRTQRTRFKRRGLFQHCPKSPSRIGIFNEASQASFSMAGKKPSHGSENYHVKLSINSFKVPELFIEIPETATVGSLKRTVMEAVTAILEGGLRVGVLLQGKKVRDDNKTLQQAGICNAGNQIDLGFSLERKSAQASPQLMTATDRHILDTGGVMESLESTPPAEPSPEHGSCDSSLHPVLTSPPNCLVSDPDTVNSHVEVSAQYKTSVNSRALVPVPPMEFEALAIVPLCKSKRSEIGQRRTRRPFSVAEVEALVQAVEQLGTGRWRDVKLRAFDDAKHRTYVDLKDKWKTLVHTARISPQQRRGEPVPQELLNRVLSAQAYWSQQQAKLQSKPSIPEACLLL